MRVNSACELHRVRAGVPHLLVVEYGVRFPSIRRFGDVARVLGA